MGSGQHRRRRRPSCSQRRLAFTSSLSPLPLWRCLCLLLAASSSLASSGGVPSLVSLDPSDPLYKPPQPPHYNCSLREHHMLTTCPLFSTMCRGLGGTSLGCTQTAGGVHASCACSDATRSVVAVTRDGPSACWLENDCGPPPPGSSRLPCVAAVSGEGCNGEMYAQCRYGDGAAEYEACVAAATEPAARCECVPLYYACLLRTAGCEPYLAQHACDNLVDSYLDLGSDPAACNYRAHCRCVESAAARSAAEPRLAAAAVAMAAFVLSALLA